MRLTHQGSWLGDVELAVEAINGAKHSIMGFTPNELWVGTLEMLRKVHDR